ncbi:MAG: hypothetical protein HYV14_04980 [Elusimicrobia bacterium]|nr:hypothetical protein [Elusimicrobiota bacterium]
MRCEPPSGAGALVVTREPLEAPYREAFEGLLAEWPEPLETARAGRPLPPGPHGVIIAFGGRAAMTAHGADAPMVAALAPGYRARGRKSATVRVELTPSPERVIRLLAAAGVRRLLVVRASPLDPDFERRARDAGIASGVAIADAILSSPDRLPGLLRRLGPAADAVWLAPDPAAVTPETFAAARDFSRARSIPFFAPTAGLVAGGVRGELTVSFGDCGREAARAARELLAGRAVPAAVYPRGASAREPETAR